MGSKDLWQTCNKHGTVADVYIARKLLEIGRRFALVRFLMVTNTGSLIDDLNKIWIETYHLFAAMNRFERKPKDSPKPIPKPTSTHSHNQPKPASHSSHANPNRSYATTLNGKSSQNHVPKETVILKSVTLYVSDLIKTCDMRNVILVKVKDLMNVLSRLKLVVFPLMLGLLTYKKIACNCGEPLFVDEDPHDNVTMGREFAGWVPDIEVMDSLSGKNSEMGISDDHDDANSENGAQDVEECEIRETNEVNEENVVNTHHFLWADDDVNIAKDHDDSSSRNQPKESQKKIPTETSEAPKGDSETISKPPGFENFKPKKHQNSHQTSSSFRGAKSSRATRSIMNVMSFNSYGMGAGKCKANSKLCNKHNISFLGNQETHSLMVDPFKVKCLWENFQFDYTVSPSSGRSDGLVSVWDPNTFTKLNAFPYENLLIVEGNWISTHMHCYMVNVYAPQDDRKKESLWHHILDFKEDFSPTPFKLYNSWILHKHLHTIVTDFWEQHVADFGSNLIVGFKNKTKTLKTIIKEWSRNRISPQAREKEDLINKLKEFGAANVRGSVSEAEIRNAIRDCRSDKSRGPDWFTFAFYKKIWDTIKDDSTVFVQDLFNTGILPQGCNTSFIALIPKISNPMVISDFRTISLIGAQYKIIAKVMENRLAQVIDSVISHEQSAFIKNRQILDGPLMVNEVIKWCNRKKAKLMVFKIDFEKAFNSVSWDYLFQVMCFMGFSEKWIRWIKVCLYSATSSVLVNGSPTREFHINRGLLQGDPLSPFFIILMEGLHVAVEDAISVGLYRGFTVNTSTLSHFFFVDDALFIGEWSRANIKSMASILECFHRVSGLKINFHKSNLTGVGVPFEERWDPILDKFSKCLSKWKSSPLSIGGRTTLLSSVLGAIGTYYFSLFPMPANVNNKLESLRSNFFWGSDVNGKKILWISWILVLASKEKGGLGIGSLYSLNHALIQKWRWRFFNNPQALWVLLIKAIHGEHGDGSSFYNYVRDQGVWGKIVRSINSMHEKDCTISDCWNNGWDLSWSRPITSGTNAHHLITLYNMLATCSLTDIEDTWTWSLGSPSFTVKSTRDHIDNCILPDVVVWKQDGTVIFLKRSTFLFGELFMIVYQLGGISVTKGLIWNRLPVQFVTPVLKQQTILYGSAPLQQPFGKRFLFGWI
uniref:RNA-directed DNA polymerase, eukaryota, reverse transcriptase zinc-binding domain protein n=1 Tax=Tanacetum cinerariifolium TaxID=118510 RepID=A0A6L2J218_TANCI|nr:RNA-directed DNA polymerase, eukaryota, reverse transcriptase zinc-binding domain protein [Tanacetum cinerariifolium]